MALFPFFVSITHISNFWVMSDGIQKQKFGVFELRKLSFDGMIVNFDTLWTPQSVCCPITQLHHQRLYLPSLGPYTLLHFFYHFIPIYPSTVSSSLQAPWTRNRAISSGELFFNLKLPLHKFWRFTGKQQPDNLFFKLQPLRTFINVQKTK